ncbi:60S ribosomal protein L6-2-like [Raphanus sativus]|uniref:60S ribosomal protein L6-2-like n=1 Tax=Raphanus sativus TaxID=3726 RepID=A0A9W3D042_RAPSA|nr:60S ribosomal protein L6-2-like [Raphanus sativus]
MATSFDLQFISNRSRHESKPPPLSPFTERRNQRHKVDQREEQEEEESCGGDNAAMEGIENLKVQHHPGTVLIILAGRFKAREETLMEPWTSPLYFFTSVLFIYVLPSSRVLTYTLQGLSVFEAERKLLSSFSESVYTREKDDQKVVDGALIKAIEAVSKLNT